MSIKTTAIAALLGVSAFAGLAGAASAETRWGQPRQHEVIARAGHLNRVIRQDYRQGEISRGRETRLLRADHRVDREDRFLARANGGYITRREQGFLNHQENQIGRRLP